MVAVAFPMHASDKKSEKPFSGGTAHEGKVGTASTGLPLHCGV